MYLPGCRKPEAEISAPAPIPSDAIAKIGDEYITRPELIEELGDNSRGFSETRVRSTLKQMIQRRFIISRAEKEDFVSQPEIRRAIDAMIVSAYTEQFIETNSSPVTVDDIAREYHDNLSEFIKPRAIRIGVLRVDSRPDETATILQAAKHADATEFAQLVARHSTDQATRYRGGDAGWIEEADRYHRWPEPVVRASWQLEAVGDLSDPIDLNDGTYLVRLNAVQPARTNSLEVVSDVIEHRLQQRRNADAQNTFDAMLTRGMQYEVYDDALSPLISEPNLQSHSSPSTPDQ